MKQKDSRNKIGIFGSVPLFAIPLTTHNELKALVAISSFQGVEEYAFPSMEKLSIRADLSLSALSKAVTGLVKKQLVARTKRYGHSNTYSLLYKTESIEEIKAENKKVSAMRRAREKRNLSDALNQLDDRNKQDKHTLNQLEHDDLNQLEHDDLNQLDDILKEHSKRTDIKEHTLSNQLQEENSLSLMNLKTKFINTLKENGITYNPSSKDTRFNYFTIAENNMTPQDLIDLIPKLIQVKKENPSDKFFNGICWNMSDLISYKAKINNAYDVNKPKVIEFKKHEPKKTVEFNVEDLKKMAGFLQ